MTEFERIDDDDRMFGPQAVVATGFAGQEHTTVLDALQSVGLGGVPVCFARGAQGRERIGNLISIVMTTGQGTTSDLPRAVIVSGLTGGELHALISRYRESGLPRPLWATVTETSIEWLLSELLSELEAEREAIEGAKA